MLKPTKLGKLTNYSVYTFYSVYRETVWPISIKYMNGKVIALSLTGLTSLGRAKGFFCPYKPPLGLGV